MSSKRTTRQSSSSKHDPSQNSHRHLNGYQAYSTAQHDLNGAFPYQSYSYPQHYRTSNDSHDFDPPPITSYFNARLHRAQQPSSSSSEYSLPSTFSSQRSHQAKQPYVVDRYPSDGEPRAVPFPNVEAHEKVLVRPSSATPPDYQISSMTSQEKWQARELLVSMVGVGSGSRIQPQPQPTYESVKSKSTLSPPPPSPLTPSFATVSVPTVAAASHQTLPPPTPASPPSSSLMMTKTEKRLSRQTTCVSQTTKPSDNQILGIKQGRRRSRSVSKIIEKDAKQGDHLRATLKPISNSSTSRPRSNSFNAFTATATETERLTAATPPPQQQSSSSSLSHQPITRPERSPSRASRESKRLSTHVSSNKELVLEHRQAAARKSVLLADPRKPEELLGLGRGKARARANSYCPPPVVLPHLASTLASSEAIHSQPVTPTLESFELSSSPGLHPRRHQRPSNQSKEPVARSVRAFSPRLDNDSFLKSGSDSEDLSHHRYRNVRNEQVNSSYSSIDPDRLSVGVDAPKRPPRSSRRVSNVPGVHEQRLLSRAFEADRNSPVPRSPLATSIPIFGDFPSSPVASSPVLTPAPVPVPIRAPTPVSSLAPAPTPTPAAAISTVIESSPRQRQVSNSSSSFGQVVAPAVSKKENVNRRSSQATLTLATRQVSFDDEESLVLNETTDLEEDNDDDEDDVEFEMVNSTEASFSADMVSLPVQDQYSAIETWRRLANSFQVDVTTDSEVATDDATNPPSESQSDFDQKVIKTIHSSSGHKHQVQQLTSSKRDSYRASLHEMASSQQNQQQQQQQQRHKQQQQQQQLQLQQQQHVVVRETMEKRPVSPVVVQQPSPVFQRPKSILIEKPAQIKPESPVLARRPKNPLESSKPSKATRPLSESKRARDSLLYLRESKKIVPDQGVNDVVVSDTSSPQQASTPLPGSFPHMFQEALDALDQPLEFSGVQHDHSGAPVDPVQILGSASPTMHLKNLALGLGLILPESEQQQHHRGMSSVAPLVEDESSDESLHLTRLSPNPQKQRRKSEAIEKRLSMAAATSPSAFSRASKYLSDQDGSSHSSDCFESADEGSEHDWRQSRVGTGWMEALQQLQRQHGQAPKRGSVSWRSSVRMELEKRNSVLKKDKRMSRRVEFKTRRASIESTGYMQQENEVSKASMSLNDSSVVSHGYRAPTPALSQPNSNSSVEDDVAALVTPTRPILELQSPLLMDQEEKEFEESFLGGAESDPEEQRLSTVSHELDQDHQRSSRRWSALPPTIDHEDAKDEWDEYGDDTFVLRNSIASRASGSHHKRNSKRMSKRMSVLGSRSATNENRKSLQAKKRLTLLMANTPVQLVEPPSHDSWRTFLAAGQYEMLLEYWGPKEMHRQDVIWELVETEKSFVQSMVSLQKVFALPLKTPAGRWIDGVPCSVARLFDWLEDIVHLHSKISHTLQRVRYQNPMEGNGPVVLKIAEALLKYIPKLDVHQPYLVKFENVTAMIEEMVKNEDNLFGQFVNMQMMLPECGNMSFSSFLLKPAQRLMKYPLFFKQLFELTPLDHADHSATDELNRATSQLIRDLNDVKAREEDYQALKELETRIKGLPECFHLATRDRKLLRQGSVHVVQLSDKERVTLGLGASRPSPPSESNSPTIGSSGAEFKPLNLVGKRLSRSLPRSPVVAEWRPRDSIWSNCSSLSTTSSLTISDISKLAEAGGSCTWTDSETVTPSSTLANLAEEPETSQTLTTGQQQFSAIASRRGIRSSTMVIKENGTLIFPPQRNANAKPSMANLLMRAGSKLQSDKEKETTLQVFVFSDVILLGKAMPQVKEPVKPPKSSKKSKASATHSMASSSSVANGGANASGQQYALLDKLGLCRVVSAIDHSGKLVDRPWLLEVELLPMKYDGVSASLQDRRSLNGAGPTSLFISFSSPAGENALFKSAEHDCTLWLRALERSFVAMLRQTKQRALLNSAKQRARAGMDVDSRKAKDWATEPVHNAHADWPRRATQVTELVMTAARAGDRSNLVALLQSGLPFPKSPSQQDLVRAASEQLKRTMTTGSGITVTRGGGQQQGDQSPATSNLLSSSVPGSPNLSDHPFIKIAVVGENVLDEVDEEREERRWWALRLSEIRKEHEIEKEMDEMTQQMREEKTAVSLSSSPYTQSLADGTSPTNLKRMSMMSRKVRPGIPIVHTSILSHEATFGTAATPCSSSSSITTTTTNTITAISRQNKRLSTQISSLPSPVIPGDGPKSSTPDAQLHSSGKVSILRNKSIKR